MQTLIHKYIDATQGHQNNLILAPTGHLGVPRSDMPQIDGKYREEFLYWIKEQGISVRNIRIPAQSLRMVQGEYNRDKVGAIMASGNTEGDPIFVSKDGYVIDGNHRLIAHLNLPSSSNYINVTELGADAIPLIKLIGEFPWVKYRGLNGF